ncbi:hypothetical protein GQX74_003189 [Glossina fuscipes]|nr:hypothetical protein GQX74_003189 [Glossina fuscipes]
MYRRSRSYDMRCGKRETTEVKEEQRYGCIASQNLRIISNGRLQDIPANQNEAFTDSDSNSSCEISSCDGAKNAFVRKFQNLTSPTVVKTLKNSINFYSYMQAITYAINFPGIAKYSKKNVMERFSFKHFNVQLKGRKKRNKNYNNGSHL